MNKFQLFVDGASRGNPGPSGIGVVLKDPSGTKVTESSYYIGKTTNNVAEYIALIIGLIEALSLGVEELEVFVDSELLERQIKGIYKIRNESLKPLMRIVRYLDKKFNKIVYNYIERKQNKEADKLANKAIEGFLEKLE